MHIKIFGLFFLAIAFTSGCTANHLDIFPKLTDPSLRTKNIAPEQLQEDVDAFVSGVVERHPDLTRFADLGTIQRESDMLKAKLTTPMTRQAFFKKIGTLSHLFNDGHTFMLWPYQEFQALKEKGGLTFPFHLAVYPEGVFLKYDYSFDDIMLLRGSRLVSINDTEVSDIFATAQRYVGGETEILRKHTVAARFPMMLWAVFGDVEQFEIELEVDGEILMINIGPNDSLKEINPLASGNSSDFVYHLLDNKTGYLKVGTFDVSPDWFEQFVDNTFQKINQQKVQNLIIDIRENTGGNTDTATYLARYLALSPFQMVSAMHERLNVDNRGVFNYRGDVGKVLSDEWDEWIKPIDSERRFNGNAYVLISPLSYSSAIVFATAVKDNDMATLVGRETGGYANQTAQGNLFNLPNSQLRVYVATKLLVRPSGDLQVSGVVPDIIVSASNAQIKAGQDADILTAQEHAANLQKVE